MPLSDMPCVVLETSSVRSDSTTRMPVSPLSVTVFPSTRLPWEAARSSMPPSLVPETVLSSSVFPLARSIPMPRSPL
jgi:hypothetical protein